jgi:hypothetical protein
LGSVPTLEPIDPKTIYARLRRLLDEAEIFVMGIPMEKDGLLFLKKAK